MKPQHNIDITSRRSIVLSEILQGSILGLMESPSYSQVPFYYPSSFFSLPNLLSLIVGDFRQCLPVIPGASRGEITAAAISNATFWRDITLLKLTVNMRLLGQAAHMTPPQLQRTQLFAKWLLDIGDGLLNDDEDNVTLPPGTSPFIDKDS